MHEDRAASASRAAVPSTAADSAAPESAAPSSLASNAGTMSHVAREPAAASAGAGLEPRTVGFTSAIGHLSLYGWLRWIHANRSDATLRVHTDAGSGNIWCGAGEIIDAEWEGRLAEDALAQMLPCSSGAVTIDFDPVQRPRRVNTPTPQLLHVTDAGPTPGGALVEQAAGQTGQVAAPTPSSAPRKDRFAELALLLAESIAPVAKATSQPPKPPPKRGWRSGYVAGALVVAALAVAGFAVGRLRATSGLARPSATEQAPVAASRPETARPATPATSASEPPIVTPRPRELSPIPFVSIEVEPTHAEIWLDRELVGRGALQLAAIHDGMLHELRFTAPEHETKTLFFRNAPPAGRVLLARVSNRDVSNRDVSRRDVSERDGPATQAVVGEGAEPAAAKRVTRQRSAAGAPARARAASAEASAPIKAPTSRTPRIELIEVQTPRVQVLD